MPALAANAKAKVHAALVGSPKRAAPDDIEDVEKAMLEEAKAQSLGQSPGSGASGSGAPGASFQDAGAARGAAELRAAGADTAAAPDDVQASMLIVDQILERYGDEINEKDAM